MKTKFILTVTLTAILTIGNSFGYFNPQRVFESYWKGYGKQVVDEYSGDYIQINYEMFNISFDAVTFTFAGHKRTIVEIDGKLYSSTVEFKACYASSTHEVYINMGKLVNEDMLPYNMQWAHNDMKALLEPVVAGLFKYRLTGSTIDYNGRPIFEIGFYNEQESEHTA